MSDVSLTADVVMFTVHAGSFHVLLIERGWPPYEGCLALPGGYVESGETSETAARRELREETTLDAPAYLERLDVYDNPDRDPRGRVVTVAYVAQLTDMPEPTAGDDARAARWVPVASVLDKPDTLAFDHHTILTDAVTRIRDVAQARLDSPGYGSALLDPLAAKENEAP